ncbi:MAG: M23 family metallopeptidase [Bacilli bacterium]|jgi:hypothetical protein|nr:M23 family metallopeptidase [Bacilli bacterium]
MIDRVLNDSTKRITQRYSSTKPHLAIDLGYRNNESENVVKAHSSGTIIELVDGKNLNQGSTGVEAWGNYILIDHGNGYKTRYCHLMKNTFLVSKGQKVNKDTPLATIGDSGNSYGRHLHFEVYENNSRIDPEPYLTKDFELLPTLKYQVHDNSHGWLSEIDIKLNPGTGSNEFAGWAGYAIDALRIYKFNYRVHDKTTNKWLSWIRGASDYAGVLGHPIDGVQVQELDYRVHLKGGNWLSWITKVDDTNYGYAGSFGKEIDRIQLRYKSQIAA